MTKADIVGIICDRLKCSKKQGTEVVELVFETMKDMIEGGETLKISGFGNFDVKQKADRRGRNPQTGEEITIEARRILTFKPSALLKKAINE